MASAWRRGSLIETIDTNFLPDTRIQAYRIREKMISLLEQPTKGWKVGAMADEVQQQQGYDGPIPGRLLATTIYPNKATIHSPWQLNLECEIAWQLNKDITTTRMPSRQTQPDTSLWQPLLAFDLTASRYQSQWLDQRTKSQRMLAQLADNGNGGFIVVGPNLPNDEFTVKLTINNKQLVHQSFAIGQSSYDALQWIYHHSHACNIPLKQGDLVLTGALNPPIALTKDDSVLVELAPDLQLSMTHS